MKQFEMALAGRISFYTVATLFISAVVTGETMVEIFPREVVVLPGGNITVLCKVQYPIDRCSIQLPGDPNPLSLHRAVNSDGISFTGVNLQRGECDITISPAVDKYNGIFKCTLPPSNGIRQVSAEMKITVAKAPITPKLEVSRGGRNSFKVGEEFLARCVVAEGRPAAKIRWFLGEEELFDGINQPTISDTPGTDLQTTSQNLTRRLQPTDHGKMLRCMSEHITNRQQQGGGGSGYTASYQMQVAYKPVPKESLIEIFGIKIGENAVMNVTIQGNPEPRLKWRVNGQTIDGGYADQSGRVEATTAINLGNGYYNATLTIASITREDTEVDYVLEASNNEGITEYRIKISTLDEPQGVDLDVGSIVGIVVAILIVLIIIFLIVFAKATNRWCFGEGGRLIKPKSRNAGETSDTESADAAQLSRAKKEAKPVKETSPKPKESPMARAMAIPRSINFKSLLPGGAKNKDKVAQVESQIETPGPVKVTQEEEERPLQARPPTDPEGNEGIVYAQLELKPMANEPKHPQDKTEYAEIVYNTQPLENKLDVKIGK